MEKNREKWLSDIDEMLEFCKARVLESRVSLEQKRRLIHAFAYLIQTANSVLKDDN